MPGGPLGWSMIVNNATGTGRHLADFVQENSAAIGLDMGNAVLPGYVVHRGDIRLPLGEGVTAIGLGKV